MISLTDEYERKVREEVLAVYRGRVGGLSIFFEKLVREYFNQSGRKKRSDAQGREMEV
ncbi:MAG TPA: hypothetical protein VFE96_04745 [Candidatus Bathyarchaeia archaeon]|jgi:hypothetical protein|nr:hypothetical protein [Candidatus Bathyarchaeia archaeon]